MTTETTEMVIGAQCGVIVYGSINNQAYIEEAELDDNIVVVRHDDEGFAAIHHVVKVKKNDKKL